MADPVRAIDPADLAPGERHRVLLHCVAPRPIALTSTVSADGRPNLAPFSYFMAGGANPPSIAISPLTTRAGGPKDTLRNIRETGEFTISVVTYEMRERMNIASTELPHGVSEWDHSGFTPAPVRRVRPMRVAESPLAIECRLFQVVRHGDGPLSANYIIGEVVQFHVAESLFDGETIDPRRVEYITRMGGDWYSRATPDVMFELAKPPRPAT